VNHLGIWRTYDYNGTASLSPLRRATGLQTTVGNVNFVETYAYADALGNDGKNMTAINAKKMVWDFEYQLQQVDLGGGGTAYMSDSAAQRCETIESQFGRRQGRICLGGFGTSTPLAPVTLKRQSLL
jgi:hypothetical protein